MLWKLNRFLSKTFKMNAFLRFILISNLYLFFLACNYTAPQTSPLANEETPSKSPADLPVEISIPQKLQLLSGEWNGIGTDRGRAFSWVLNHDQLKGTYFGKKNAKEDYTLMFRFQVEEGVICCLPGSYGGKCGTPHGTYRLTEQTDSSYIFVEDKYTSSKTVSTIQFLFEGQNKMTYSQIRKKENHPASILVRHFQKK